MECPEIPGTLFSAILSIISSGESIAAGCLLNLDSAGETNVSVDHNLPMEFGTAGGA